MSSVGLCRVMVLLSAAALGLGVFLSPHLAALATGDNVALPRTAIVALALAEAVKLASAVVGWRLAKVIPTRSRFLAHALRIAAVLLALAGLAGLAGIALSNAGATLAVQALALLALLFTAAWGAGAGAAREKASLRAILIALSILTACLAVTAPVWMYAGILAGVAQTLFWALLARAEAA